jgi:hypothetical protein
MNDIQKKIREELAKVQNSKFAKRTDAQLAASDETGSRTKALHSDPSFKKQWTEKNTKRYQDSEYAKKVGSKISNTYNTPEGKKKQASKFKGHTEEAKEKLRKANIGKKRKDEPWVQKMAEKQKGNKSRSKPIVTPSGTFLSLKLAADWAETQGLKGARNKINTYLLTNPTEFYYIRKSEFKEIQNIQYNKDLDWLKNTDNRNGGKPVEVQTPNGLFPTRKAAAKYYGVDPNTIASWILKKKEGFFYKV